MSATTPWPPASASAPTLLFSRPRMTAADERVFIAKLALALSLGAAGVALAVDHELVLRCCGAALLAAVYTHVVELQHQCLHHSAFRKIRLHRITGVVLGMPMLVMYSHYRIRHLQHHRYLGTAKDSEFFGFDTSRELTGWSLLGSTFNYLRLLHVFREIYRCVRGTWTYDIGQISERMRRAVISEYRALGLLLLGAAGAAAAGYGEYVVWLWLIPLAAAIPAHFLLELPEHVLCDTASTDVLRNTRSIRGSRFSTWFTNGNNLHIEHHAAMTVPINRLPERHAEARRLAEHVLPGYPTFFRQVLREVRANARRRRAAGAAQPLQPHYERTATNRGSQQVPNSAAPQDNAHLQTGPGASAAGSRRDGSSKIIIIGVNPVTMKYLPTALRSAGYEPKFVLDVGAFHGESRRMLDGCEYRQADIEQTPVMLDLIDKDPEFFADAAAITGFFDDKFPLIEMIAKRHGLRHPDPAAARLARKDEVLRLLPEYSPRHLVFGPDEVGAVDFRAAAAWRHGAVLKPGLVSGGVGTALLAPHEVSADRVNRAIAECGLPDPNEHVWILQERISGRLISLEGYVIDGAATFIGIGFRGRFGFTEVTSHLPGDSRVDPDRRNACREIVKELIARSGMSTGYFHSEFLLGETDQWLVDANMGRIGGAAVCEQLALAHALRPEQVLRHAALLGVDTEAAGPPPPYRPIEEAQPTVAYLYGLQDGGLVKSVDVPADFAGNHTQFARPGLVAPPVGSSDSAWVGVVSGPVGTIEREMQRIGIETSSGTVGPWYAPSE